MKGGQRIAVEVTGLSPEGDGIAVVDGRTVVLRRSLPGDQVEATVRRRRRGRIEAEVEALVRAGVPRLAAPCVHFGVCGGCRWQDLAYDEQLTVKHGMVRSQLEGQGLLLPPVPAVLPSPRLFHYRNKMEFSFAPAAAGGVDLGLHLHGRYNRIFDLEACHLQSEASNRVALTVRALATELGLPAYDLRSHTGLLRFLVVRDTKQTGQLMANLVVSAYPDAAVDRLCARIVAEVPEIDTLVVSLQASKGQTAVGQSEHVLKGQGYLVERCNGIEYEISARSFFQTNPLQAERLYEVARRVAGHAVRGMVLDLYCGNGGIALQLAPWARGVTGIESVPQAVADACRNALRNGIANCTFRAELVEDVLESWHDPVPDLVVADPPRSGMHPRAVAALAALAPPRIVYVSCNPATLARDLTVLAAAGYGIEAVQPVDMFPHTAHCEVVVGLVGARRSV